MDEKSKLKEIFTPLLMNWHQQVNDREMPWKGEKDPYKIWLSEIILQQTRVAQGLPYYNRFIQYYPTLSQLAAAPDEAIFKLWEGLGYYSRCRNLLACARQVVAGFDGFFPADYDKILSLKGIGPYTAAAIASFGFGLPHAVVDGNVTRVLSRYFGISTPIDSTEGKKIFSRMANELLPKEDPAGFNQAIMDFGAVVCTPSRPSCPSCPFRESCIAFKKSLTEQLPVKVKKLVKKQRYFTYFLVRANGKILTRQRSEKDIWQNLNEYFLVESADAPEWEKVTAAQHLAFADEIFEIVLKGHVYKQHLSHQTIFARFIEVNCHRLFPPPHGYEWKTTGEVEKLAFPRIINLYVQELKNASISLF